MTEIDVKNHVVFLHFSFTTVYSLVFYRAANLGNPEALIKLGLAHLYNEGSKWNFTSKFLNEK